VADEKRLTAGIIVFDNVEEIDFVGPWEVFTMAAQIGAPLDVFTVGYPRDAIRCAKGLYVIADHTFDTAPPADIVLVPGGRGTRTLVNDQAFLRLLTAYVAPATWKTSVCTGSALLGKAGFLDGRAATTNRNAFDFFRASAPNARLIEDQRYVLHGDTVTAAGLTAGLDMCLWLVGRIFGEDVARTTQTFMEYFPEPPFAQ
jgi:transcriptional regulator GlxA family with amidase domain